MEKIDFLYQHLKMMHTIQDIQCFFLPKVDTKDYNVMIDGKNVFDQPGKNDLRAYDNVWKIKIVQEHHYTTGF